MTRRRIAVQSRRFWTGAEEALLREIYADTSTADIAAQLGCTRSRVYVKAERLGLKKSAAYLASPAACRLCRDDNIGAQYRYRKGNVPANKGVRRPGWGPGRMKDNWFQPGCFPANRDPDFYVLGALRVNTDGYIDMRVSFEPGSKGWRALHLILWEDTHGPIPKSHAVCFRNGDKLDVELANLELVSRADLMRRNTIHNYPPEIARAVQLVGALHRKINQRTGNGKKHRSAA